MPVKVYNIYGNLLNFKDIGVVANMCLSIPGKLIEKNGQLGKVDVDGNEVNANLMVLGDVEVGDYVLVHAGFAIQKYEEQEALETIRMLKEVLGEDS